MTSGVMRTTKVWLAIEYAALFFALVGIYTLARIPGGPIPPLVVLAAAAWVYLRRRPDFDNRDLVRADALRRELRGIVSLWAVTAVLVIVVLAVFQPERLFIFPREAPVLWAAVMVLYPLLSVYPQELIFRAFLMSRYAAVFGTGAGIAAASAAAFGFAHIIFGNLVAVVSTTVGGWLFARRYQRSRSLLSVSIEHAAYGALVFTVGLGDLFYHGAR